MTARFYVSGNTLMPLQETQISLRKEVLKFYVCDFKWMNLTPGYYLSFAEADLSSGFKN